MTTTGRQGFGYWDTTRRPHQIGECFRRFGQNETVTDITELDRPYRGATHSGNMIRDGKVLKIAFNAISVQTQ